MQTIYLNLFDNNEPIAVPVYSDDEEIKLNKLVFTNEDNQYIPKKGSVTLYTCTWKSYVALRNTLTRLFSGFITLPMYNNGFVETNKRINPANQAFLEVLDDPQHELFVVPAHQDIGGGTIYPEGGVRLVTDRFIRAGKLATRTINIYIGERLYRYSYFLSDQYFDFESSMVKEPVNLDFI